MTTRKQLLSGIFTLLIVYFTKLLRYRDADIYFCDEKLRYRNLNCSLMIDLFDILIPKPTKRYPSIFGNKDCYP